MQQVITKLTEKHGIDLTASQASLRLDMPGFDRLVIEKIGAKLVKVAHYYEQHGRLIPDPEIIFFIDEKGWIPFEIEQVIGGRRTHAVLSTDGQSIGLLDYTRQWDLADFADTMWADNIEMQDWLEDGIKWDPCDPTTHEQPDLETLIAWVDEGIGCEAIDGCWVEEDGTCEHGCPSWLLALGLI
jgi:hypothetical protein